MQKQQSKMILKMDPDELVPIRVQYLADSDPYECASMFPTPSRAPTYSFPYTVPLATQLGSILRLLGAPQRVRVISIVLLQKKTETKTQKKKQKLKFCMKN